MTVRELIGQLRTYPLDLRVVTPGFDEGGYDDIGVVRLIRLLPNVYGGGDTGFSYHCGPHEDAEDLNVRVWQNDSTSQRMRACVQEDAVLVDWGVE